MEEFFEEKDVQLYNRGDILEGRVLQSTDEVVLVDIGYKSEAQLRKSDLGPFRNGEIQPDEEIEVIITYIDEEEGSIYVSEKQAIYVKSMIELLRVSLRILSKMRATTLASTAFALSCRDLISGTTSLLISQSFGARRSI